MGEDWLIATTSRQPDLDAKSASRASRRPIRGKYRGVRAVKAVTFISLLLMFGVLLPAAAHASVFNVLLGAFTASAEAKTMSSASS